MPDLLLLLEDERPFVRRNALHVLAHMREPKALAPALELLQGDPEWIVRFDAVTVLCWLGDQRAVPTLVRVSREDKAPQVRRGAAWGLQCHPGCERPGCSSPRSKTRSPRSGTRPCGSLRRLEAD